MKALSIFRKSILGISPLGFLAGVAAAVLVFAPLPAAAEKDRMEPGRTLSGNYLAGRHAQARRDLSAAADFLGAALKRSPDAPDLLRRTFVLMTVEGRIDEAAALAQRLIDIDATVPVAYLTLAVADIKRGRYGTAEQRLKDMPGNGLGGFVAPVLRAWSLMGMKKSRDALKLLKPNSKEQATKTLHALHAALISEMLGRNAEAEKYYLSINGDQDNRSLRVVQLLGALYERTGKPEKARLLYENYLKAQPGSQFLDEAMQRLKSGGRAGP